MTTLSPQVARARVIEAIGFVAPDIESELATLDPHCDAFDELQLDSMDHLNVMTALAQKTGIEIPESQYPELRSLERLTRYLSQPTRSVDQ
jgi:acyl carrier protein